MLTLKYKKKYFFLKISYIVDLLLITFITTSIFKLFFSPFFCCYLSRCFSRKLWMENLLAIGIPKNGNEI